MGRSANLSRYVQTALVSNSVQLERRILKLLAEQTSENSKRALEGDLKYWEGWLSAIGQRGDDAITSRTVIQFMLDHAEGLPVEIDARLCESGIKQSPGPHSLATIFRRIESLAVYFRLKNEKNPCRTESVRQVMRKLRRKYAHNVRRHTAITKTILEDLLRTCDGNRRIDYRDRAMMLFAWGSGGRRRSEVCAAQYADLHFLPTKDFLYRLPYSKTDQTGEGVHVPVKGRVAAALLSWLREGQIEEGALFRRMDRHGNVYPDGLTPHKFCKMIKTRAERAGYNPARFGAHSLRSGFVTEAGRQNKPLGDVMALTTHKDVRRAMSYYRAGNAIHNSCADMAD